MANENGHINAGKTGNSFSDAANAVLAEIQNAASQLNQQTTVKL